MDPINNGDYGTSEPSRLSRTIKKQAPCVRTVLFHGVQTSAAAFCSWNFTYIMNDPNRNPDQALDFMAYPTLMVATALMISTLVASLFRNCTDKPNAASLLAPFTLIISAVSLGVLIGASIRTAQANKIYNEYEQINSQIDLDNAYAKNQNQNLLEACHGTLEEFYNAFTIPNCSVCTDTQETEFISSVDFLYPAAIVQRQSAFIDQVHCKPENASSDYWNGIANYSNTNHTGQGLCAPDYNSLDPQAKATIGFYLRTLYAGLPINISAYPLPNGCYRFEGTVTYNFTLTRLCSYPSEIFDYPAVLRGCMTEDFIKYALSYNQTFTLLAFKDHLSYPSIAKKLATSNIGLIESLFSGIIGAITGMTYFTNHCWQNRHEVQILRV
ncbi:MAG: hypothetical protein ACK5MA_08320 [Parachlamydiaceae bacterium]